MQDVINTEAVSDLSTLSREFGEASPFRHVLIRDFLADDFYRRILGEFPEAKDREMRSEFGKRSRKHAVHDVRSIGPTFRRWDDTLQSPAFISMLETITGIEELLFDPEYHGAGTHNNMNGQGMDVHIDFNLHRSTGFHRRLNLIVYLGPEWDPSWGGNLELHKNPWDRENDFFRTYPPYGNHAVLFETNEHSWHGFDRIQLPEDKLHVSRKSLTVYYYTRTRPAAETARKHGTIYVQKGIPDSVQANEVLTPQAYQELRQTIKRRDDYLKSLYERESDLLERIEDLKLQVRQLQRGFGVIGRIAAGLDRRLKRWLQRPGS